MIKNVGQATLCSFTRGGESGRLDHRLRNIMWQFQVENEHQLYFCLGTLVPRHSVDGVHSATRGGGAKIWARSAMTVRT